MDDLIRRQDALVLIDWYDHRYSEIESYLDIIREDIKSLPSAQKTGKWKKHILKDANIQWGYDCSSCGEWFVIGRDYIKRYKHCPNCGAYMKGEEDG